MKIGKIQYLGQFIIENIEVDVKEMKDLLDLLGIVQKIDEVLANYNKMQDEYWEKKRTEAGITSKFPPC